MARILFIMTGSDHWTLNDGTTTPTGYWAEEAIVPLQAFEAASHEVVVATPGGIKSPLDPASLRVEDGDHYRRIDAASPALNHPVPLDSVSAADFDAVYVPGGHGPMEDLAVDAVSGALLTAFRDAAKPVGAVCHGPAALLAATRADGRGEHLRRQHHHLLHQRGGDPGRLGSPGSLASADPAGGGRGRRADGGALRRPPRDRWGPHHRSEPGVLGVLRRGAHPAAGLRRARGVRSLSRSPGRQRRREDRGEPVGAARR